MKLRPHHLLCTQSFNGKGYSKSFVENMTAITNQLRNEPDIKIDIVFSTDDICSCCPNMADTDLCKTNDKVKRYDQKVVDYFGIEQKSYVYADIVREINSYITESMLDDICSDCNWYLVSDCKRNILK